MGNNITEYNSLLMNPITYSSLLSLSETDRRVTDDKDFRGQSAKAINFINKKFVLESHAIMRTDRIIGAPKDGIQMFGGELEPVEASGQREFIALNSSGRRTNAIESYNTITGEQVVENPRRFVWVHNFSQITL
jgi:hypothetical protein